MAELMGQLLGRFRLLEEVAKTAAATLYHARDEVDGAPAGVCVVAQDAIRTFGGVRAFVKRVQLLRGMESPHLGKVLAGGMQDGTWFLATGGAPGITLERLTERLGALPREEALALSTQLFRALSHLHARNVVVRQLSPVTALLGADGVVRIWALTGVVQPKSASRTLQLSKMDYAGMIYAPTGDGAASRARDVYGAGMTMAHLVAGGAPVRPNSLPELLAFVQKPVFPFQVPLEAAVEKVLLSTVSPAASKRPPARRVYGQLMAATGLKPRQILRLGEQAVARL